MKPLVSAAAAALLLVGSRRSGALSPIKLDDDDQTSLTDDAIAATDTATDTIPTSLVATDTDNDSAASYTEAEAEVESEAEAETEAEAEKARRSPTDWDWSRAPDDASILAATAAILADVRSRPSPSPLPTPDPSAAMSPTAHLRDALDTLVSLLRGLGATSWRPPVRPDPHVDPSASSGDFRPLIAVTIGLTIFLLTRSPRAARRAELEAGANDGPLIVDETDLLPVDADYSVVSDLATAARDIVIVTTAALPWMTGTAVNPLLRAVYLAKAGHRVSLVVPWLESPEDQRVVYPKGTVFSSRNEQSSVIMAWARDQVPDVEIRILFYEGVYSKEFGSILPLGDITSMFGDDEPRDVCVLEEPEHLTWFHTGRRWTSLFNFCVGVVHTNYLEYAKKHGVFGPQRALFLNFLNKWVCRSYCHRVIKLSDAVQALPHSVTCNVHGVRDKFIDIGRSRRGKSFESGAYFLGKVLWAKGYAQLVELMEEHYERTEQRLPIDFFGAGPDLDEVRARVAANYALSSVQIHGVVVDHASEYLQRYKVYVNPSKSDVVCTATAEALAMGKFVICLKHPSNKFFETFDNCLIYESAEEFSGQLAFALANEPRRLSESDAYRLSWEAATQRFYDASHVPSSRASGRVDSALALTHKTICATLVRPPANNAVRARYRRERKNFITELAKSRRTERSNRVSVH